MLTEILNRSNIATVNAVCLYIPGTEELERKLMGLPYADRITFLLRALIVVDDRSHGYKEIAEALGKEMANNIYHRRLIIFTLSNDGKEFRCWYDWHGAHWHGDHVDSCGQGLFFSINGEKEGVMEYVIALTKEHSAYLYRSGVTLFLPSMIAEELEVAFRHREPSG